MPRSRDASRLPKRKLTFGADHSHLTRHIRDVIPGAPIPAPLGQAHGRHARSENLNDRQPVLVIRVAVVEGTGV